MAQGVLGNPARPWTDPDTLRSLYLEQSHSADDVADALQCSKKTILKWLDRHGIPTRPSKHDMDNGWRDPDLMHELYIEKGISIREIARELDCEPPTIHRWLHNHGIETRQAHRDKPPYFRWDQDGHATVSTKVGEKQHTVMVHRLVAVAEFGIEAVKGHVVHHKNHVPWDNRPGNLELMTHGEHSSYHQRLLVEDGIHHWLGD